MMMGIDAHRNDYEAIEDGQIADYSKDGFLLGTDYMCRPNEFSRAAEPGAGPGSRNAGPELLQTCLCQHRRQWAAIHL
jgi:hypothetical protein